MKLPKAISNLINHFERLPGIGPKSAQRLTFHLLHFPQEDLSFFADSLKELKENTQLCSVCKNVSENDICVACDSDSKDKRKIAVVAGALDAFALSKTGFDGVFHVLHGLIDPLNNIGPEEIFIGELLERLDPLAVEGSVEIILATNSSMEGESTAMYISKLIRDRDFGEDSVVITRIARGLPVGGDIEYADDITLSRALDGRSSF